MLKGIVTVGGLALILLVAVPAFGVSAESMIADLKDGTADRRLAAAMGLADYVQFPEVVTALAQKLDDTTADPVLRANCAASLGRSADPSVYPMVQTLAKKTEEKPIVRAGCVIAMGMIKQDAVVPEFIEMLKTEKSLIVRQQVEQALQRMPNAQAVVTAVSPLLNLPESESSAIRVLGAVGGPAVIAPMAKQLETKTDKRRVLIEAIGMIRSPDAAKALIAFYPKADDAEKVQILGVLASHPIVESVTLLVSELENPKTFLAVRRRAALSLGMLKAPGGIHPLVKILLNTAEDDGLRRSCVGALANFGDHDDDAIAGLIGCLPDKKLAEDAAVALNRITRRYFGTDKQKWAEWFQEWRRTRDSSGGVGH